MTLLFILRHPIRAWRICTHLDGICHIESMRATYEAVGIATPEWLAFSYLEVLRHRAAITQLQGEAS